MNRTIIRIEPRYEKSAPVVNQSKQNEVENQRKKKQKHGDEPFANRKPISELLHDIYDAK